VEHGAASDEALALIARIDRLANAAPAGSAPRRLPAEHQAAATAVPSASARWRWIGAGAIGGIVLGAVALVAFARGSAWSIFGSPEFVPVSTLNAPLPVPTIGETALAKAQVLYARGRLQEALAELAAVPSGDSHRPRADELAAAIERQLLAAARSSAGTPTRRP
jgi:hypothetical protein